MKNIVEATIHILATFFFDMIDIPARIDARPREVQHSSENALFSVYPNLLMYKQILEKDITTKTMLSVINSARAIFK